MSDTEHCPTCGQHHLAESDTEELHAMLAKCERLEREVLAENERLRRQLAGAVDALDEALEAARTFNRNGMTWLEYDRLLARLKCVVNQARGQ